MVRRTLRMALGAVGIAAWFSACDTDAVAVEDCREIERARCRAALFCDLGIDNEDDVEACDRFARDNCLHGFETEEEPRGNAVEDCVEAIAAAGACAKGAGPDSPAATCAGLGGPARRSVCDVIQDPEEAAQCAFLIPEPPPPEPEPDAAASPDGATD